jgi:hypothetical protein
MPAGLHLDDDAELIVNGVDFVGHARFTLFADSTGRRTLSPAFLPVSTL